MGAYVPITSAGSFPAPSHLREDAVDDAVGQGMVAVAQQVLLADVEVVVGVQLPELGQQHISLSR